MKKKTSNKLFIFNRDYLYYAPPLRIDGRGAPVRFVCGVMNAVRYYDLQWLPSTPWLFPCLLLVSHASSYEKLRNAKHKIRDA